MENDYVLTEKDMLALIEQAEKDGNESLVECLVLDVDTPLSVLKRIRDSSHLSDRPRHFAKRAVFLREPRKDNHF